eukprot:CAMPEP_0117569704 /NCGR_PEP_ID=MMETSP0784-20121206/58800_1 /TAXON_ID=39447 /ORGANISM="" /LENGTH=234 /DNA_ID=CAMNT_0005367695 /DNA_START=26 /DNA_END=730 /DNA_ORIENTATION=-
MSVVASIVLAMAWAVSLRHAGAATVGELEAGTSGADATRGGPLGSKPSQSPPAVGDGGATIQTHLVADVGTHEAAQGNAHHRHRVWFSPLQIAVKVRPRHHNRNATASTPSVAAASEQPRPSSVRPVPATHAASAIEGRREASAPTSLMDMSSEPSQASPPDALVDVPSAPAEAMWSWAPDYGIFTNLKVLIIIIVALVLHIALNKGQGRGLGCGRKRWKAAGMGPPGGTLQAL